ncbi:MAG: EAL domain-containing protein [Deltaproteobacteria bacterium]|nr:EAL domain-containing protein [Deltaproteobacteria bacterium]MBW2360636.1 EAL domain-containing protein [Deltaproteobacteria bacterium]
MYAFEPNPDVVGRIRVVLVGEAAERAREVASLLAQLRDAPFEVVHSRCLSEALERHANEPFDALLWDFGPSDLDGIGTLESVTEVATQVPVLVLADSDDAAQALQALRIGVQDVVVRSEIEPASLGRALRHAIERHRQLQQLREAGEQARFLATHDALTRLANRSAFQLLLARSLALAERRGTQLALLFLDLDGFKHINDTLGHSVGDELICQVAGRLANRVRKSDMLARLGGDEFVVMLQDTGHGYTPAKAAQELLETLAAPYELRGRDYWVTASIGISVFPRDGADQDVLIRSADAAMFKAKSLGRNNYQFYSQTLGTAAVRRLDLECKLRCAFENGCLEVHYQPVLDIERRCITGVEALLRWTDPELGAVPACEIISLAEETGLIAPIGSWVLETACRDAVAWQREDSPVRVMVNISAHQLVQSQLRDTIVRTLWETGLQPAHLGIELTETAFMRDEASAIEVLEDLKEIGVDLSLDDFGTGFSSLSYLKRMPVDTLKIDRSFVRDIAVDADDAAITAAILSIAKTLDLGVVAEGVETIEQLDLLASHGCRVVQGFLFSPAVPADAFAKLLRPGTFDEIFLERVRRKGAQAS